MANQGPTNNLIRNLSSTERLQVLISVGALKGEFSGPLTHDMERKLLDAVARTGRIEEIEEAIETAIRSNN